MRRRFLITLLVIVRSLFPAGRRTLRHGSAAVPGESGYTPVPVEDIPLYLCGHDLITGNCGKLALYFPGCAALAAPFLLFRLKREGFSGCRVTVTGDGLLVDATR